MSGVRASVIMVLGGLLLLAQPLRAAEEDSKAAALRAFEAGTAHYQRGEYPEAIERFEAGYHAVPQPVFLYNIGQSYRMSSQPQRAIAYYRRYLRQHPGAHNFNEVNDRITALEHEIAEDRRRPVPRFEPPPAALVPPPAPPPRRRVWPIVLGVVGGAVVAGAAVGLGVRFGAPGGPPLWSPVTP